MDQVLAALARIEDNQQDMAESFEDVTVRLDRIEENQQDMAERLGKIENRLDRSMSREFRLNSTHCAPELAIHWIPAARGALPDGRPELQQQLVDMDHVMCLAIEQAYELVPAEGADIVARRAAISNYLGVVYR